MIPSQLNEAVYELYKPTSAACNLDIVFFHGLQLQDYSTAYTETWLSARADECWPGTWLAHDFPRARILSVSYDSSAIRGSKQGNRDMEATGESLLDCLVCQAGQLTFSRFSVFIPCLLICRKYKVEPDGTLNC